MFPPPDYQLLVAQMAEMQRLAAAHRASRPARDAARGRIATRLRGLVSSADRGWRRPGETERPGSAGVGRGVAHLPAADVGSEDEGRSRPVGAARIISLTEPSDALDQPQVDDVSTEVARG